MGYRVVTVNPLKPFPIAYFGLANVASLDDAKGQIRARSRAAATKEIEANEDYQALDAKVKEASGRLVHMEKKGQTDAVKKEIERAKNEIKELEAAREEIAGPIRKKHEVNANAEIALLEKRWAEGKIEPALELHLARQERRLAHFNGACRFFGCDNPHPLGSPYFWRFGRGAARGSSVPKSTGQATTQGIRRHSPQFFCGSHRWLKSQLASGDYAMLSDPKYRVKIA